MGSNDEKEKIIEELLKLEGEKILGMYRDFEENRIRENLREYTTEFLKDFFKKEEKEKIKILLRQLAIMEYILNKNYKKLSDSIEEGYEVLEEETIKEFPSINMLIKMREISLHLHNYLSCVYSLDQYTQRFYDILDSQELNRYKTQLKKLENEELKCFLIRLRVVLQHYRLSPLRSGMHKDIEEEKIDRYIVWNKKELLDLENIKSPAWEKWRNNGGWKSKGRKYIKNCGEKIELKGILKEYQNITKKFYSKLYKKVIEIYSKKYPEMEKEILTLEKIRSVE